MKITRVLLAANENPIYYEFWNPLSQVYAEKFGIQPTLIWFGKSEDIDRLGLSRKWGNILIQEPIPRCHIGWQSAWSIFWFMSLYPKDIFCTMGIDQIPLSGMLIRDVIFPYYDDDYVMLVDDGYHPSHWESGETSPTSFHIVKGSVAEKVYGFEHDFHQEIEKIEESGIIPYYDKMGNNWGLDESYSSHKLRQYLNSGGKIQSRRLFKFICDNRIECCRENETPYDSKRLSDGQYGDAHLCRPFSAHKDYIEKMLSLIPRL